MVKSLKKLQIYDLIYVYWIYKNKKTFFNKMLDW